MARIAKGWEAIEIAAKKLQTGYVVSFPTETVYGLGADARDGIAVASIYAMKGRPQFNPLIVHVGTISEAKELGVFDEVSLKLAEAFWPGPLTLVVPRKPDCGISELVTAGLDTIAIRIPSHTVARELLGLAGCPIAAPSANVSGHVSPTTAQHVADDFDESTLLIVDGGTAECGLESTVVTNSKNGLYILRHGSVTKEDIEEVADETVHVSNAEPDQPLSPGQLIRHYATDASIRLNAESAFDNEALLAFGKNVPEGAARVLNLSATGDLKEASSNLFSMLRELDSGDVSTIAVMPIPDRGLGMAINDRLKRAATVK